MNGVVREVNVKVQGRGMELLVRGECLQGESVIVYGWHGTDWGFKRDTPASGCWMSLIMYGR